MPDKPKSYELIPEAGDPKVGKKVFEILAKVVADKVSMGLHERWFRNYQLRKGKHWKGESASGVPLVSANLIYTHIQRTTNQLTDNNPTFNVVLAGELDDEQKELMSDLQRATEYWWNETEQQDVFETSVLNGETYGPAIEKVIFNPDAESGLGEAEAIPIDPYRFGWFPVRMEQTRDLQKKDVVLHYYPMQLRKLRAKYPKLADKIKADKEVLADLMDAERREIGGTDAKKGQSLVTISSAIKHLVNFVTGEGGSEEDEETLVVEAWVRDRSRGTPTETTREDGKKELATAPKYKGEIRYILACSGGLVLEDRDNPNVNPNLSTEEAQKTYLYDKFPFTIASSVKDTSNAWGMCDVDQMEWLMMEINKALSQFILEKDRSARKKLKNPLDSGVQDHELTNYTSIIHPVNAQVGAGVEWMETPPVSNDYEKTLEIFKTLLFMVAGTFDIDQAQVGGREVIAYKAIAALLERAATMSRGKIRAYSRLIRERGRMYGSHVMNFYTEPRWITFKDKDGNDATKQITGSKMVIPAKLTVVSGSTLPVSQVQRREEAISLADKGHIDKAELLDKLDWPNRNDVLKRMQAGPLGQALSNLQSTGMPEPMLQFIRMIAEADPKKIAQGLKSGDVPDFMQFFRPLMEQMLGQEGAGDPAANAEFQVKQAEVKKALAEAEKITAEIAKVEAERDLTVEKTLTERVQQQVKLAGVEFDKETLTMDRAKLVTEIDARDKGLAHENDKMMLDAAVKVSAQKNKPGYNEKGMKSNNKEA